VPKLHLKNKEEVILKLYKCREVKTPEYGSEGAAGIDFFVPKFTKELIEKIEEDNYKLSEGSFTIENDTIIVYPNTRFILPLGIRAYVPESTALVAKNKSGVSLIKGVVKLAELVDSDYHGEIFFTLLNTSRKAVYMRENDKIIQFIHTPILRGFEMIDDYKVHSERGEGALGSTGS